MKDDELVLWRRYREGDQDALEGLLLYYKRLVRVWVNSVIKAVPDGDREDLIQEGMIRLAAVIERFDPDKGNEFTTYARQRVLGALYNSLRLSRNWTRHQYEHYKRVVRAQDVLVERLERRPTMEEISEEAGLTLRQTDKALDARNIAFPEFMDAHDSTMDSIPNEGRENLILIILIRELLLNLDEMERRILVEYYDIGRTDVEISEQLGLKREQAKTIRRSALKRLRKLLEASER